METLVTWIVLAVFFLAILNFIILPVLLFIVKFVLAIVESFEPRRVKSVPRPIARVPPSPALSPPTPAAATESLALPAGMTINPELEFGRWGPTIVPYTTTLAALIAQYKPALAADDQGSISKTAAAIISTLDRMEANLTAPPNLKAAYHWSAMILLLRKSSFATIEGVNRTRNLLSATHYLHLATIEMDGLVQSMTEWSDKCDAGEFD